MSQVNQIIEWCFRQLRLIKSYVKSLTFEAARAAKNVEQINNVKIFVISIANY